MTVQAPSRPRNGVFPSVPSAGPLAPSPRGSIRPPNRPTSIPTPTSGIPPRAPTPSTTGWAPPAPGYRPIPGVPGAYRNPTTGAPAWGRNLAQEAAENAGIARQAAQDRASGAAARAAARNNSLANAGRPRRIPVPRGALGWGLGALNTLGNAITVGELLGQGINAFICSQQPLAPQCNPSRDPFFDSPISDSPPFEGGQCPGIPYLVTGFGTRIPPGEPPQQEQINNIGVGPFSQRRTTGPGTQLLLLIDGSGRTIFSIAGSPETEMFLSPNFTRRDGLPDDCRSPGVNPEVVPAPNPTLPLDDRHPVPAPRPQPQPRPRPTPEPRPQPGFDPDGQPIPEPENQPQPTAPTVPRVRPRPTPRPRPVPQPRPQPQPEPAQPQPPQPGADCCNRTLGLLNEVLALLKAPQSGVFTLSNCDDEQTLFGWNAQGLAGINAALSEIGRSMDVLLQSNCDSEAYALIPEAWQLKAGNDRPQALVAFESPEKSRWQLTIPHYHLPADAIPNIPSYTKGNSYAAATLRDNSKIWVNAASEGEALAVVNACLQLVSPDQRPSPPIIQTGKTRGNPYATATVKPVRLAFYPNGQRSSRPQFTLYFNDANP